MGEGTEGEATSGSAQTSLSVTPLSALDPPLSSLDPLLEVRAPCSTANAIDVTASPTAVAEGKGTEGEDAEGGWMGDGTEGEGGADKFVKSLFDTTMFEELVHSVPPSPPITPKPEQREGRQHCSAAHVVLALAALVALLLLLPLFLAGAPPLASQRGGWTGSEPPTSVSHTAPNGSAWLAGCPAGWSAAPGGQCFRASKNQVAHDRCTEECSAEGGAASLACVGSTEENDFLRDILVPGRPYWVGLYKEHNGWSWATGRCVGSQFMNWIRSAAPSSGEGGGALHDGEEVSQVKSSQVKSSQVEQASGRGECALFMGATGRLDKSSCEWAGYQCVCELGAELLPAYSRSMLSSRRARDRAAKRLRKYVVTLFSMALGLPLLLDKRLLHLGQWMWMFRRGRGSTSADEVASKVASPSRQTVHRALLVHVAWALIFTGWAPFVWQAMSGTWDDSRLGCWPNWAPLGALGGVLMHETAPLRHFRPACMVMGMGSCIVSAAILTYYPHVSSSRIDRGTALAHQADSDPLDAWDEGVDRWLQTHNLHNSAPALSLDSAALRFALYCFWFASAALNGCAGADLLVSVARNAPPHQLHAKIAFWMRACTSVCGSLLCVVLVTLHMVHSLQFVLEDYAMGTVATALSLAIIGFISRPRWLEQIMGTASNGLSATRTPLVVSPSLGEGGERQRAGF